MSKVIREAMPPTTGPSTVRPDDEWSGQFVFLEQAPGGNTQRLCQSGYIVQRDVANTALHVAEVGSINPCFECKCLLAQTLLRPQ